MLPLTQHKITVREYFSIGELNTQTELINGVIYDMVPPGPKHSSVLRKLLAKLYQNDLQGIIISPEQPINLQEFNAPQPDIAILADNEDEYTERHPLASEVYTVIELSDSTLEYDRTIKAEIYANTGISEYIIIDLQNSRVLEYSEPSESGYQKVTEKKGITISKLNLHLSLSELL